MSKNKIFNFNGLLLIKRKWPKKFNYLYPHVSRCDACEFGNMIACYYKQCKSKTSNYYFEKLKIKSGVKK